MAEYQRKESMCCCGPGVCPYNRLMNSIDIISGRYYEWLTKGKEKIPHFFKHDDGKLMLFAGLYDSVLLEGASLS